MKACVQGGHQTLVRAETGAGFGSVRECIQHGALGGSYSLLAIDTSARYTCPDGGTCWGVVIGQGLQAVIQVNVTYTTPSGSGSAAVYADNLGDVTDEPLNFPCGTPITDASAAASTSAGANIVSASVNAPC